jgi:hypothetical protein
MGRNSKPPEQRRKDRITVSCTKDELAVYEWARQVSTTDSENAVWARQVLDAEVARLQKKHSKPPGGK